MTRSVFDVGNLIENRYRVLSVMGSGGMGTLYRVADETQADEVLALKMVKLDAPEEAPESVARFQREFQILTQLRHPNLVSVYDYGVTAGGQLYFTMEWVPGQDLEVSMRQLTPEAVIPVMVQVCRALAYLHARGVIHGDLKPANVLLVGGAEDAEPRVKLVDFGVALEMRDPEARARYYTPNYAAPEMRQLRPVDQRADLYSLGAVWYALSVGEPPPSPQEMFGYERLVRFTLLEALEGQVAIPAALGAVVARLLAEAPGDRYASANEVIAAVNEVTGSAHALETQETAASYALRVRFVNREPEFAVLQSTWAQARSHEGQLVLVSGESGVGKTRLIEELEVRAELEGARVVWGQCVERGGGAYQPWREVLRVLVRYVEAANEAAVQQVGPVLATLLPALWEREYMTGLIPPAELDPQAAQQRLHDAIVQVLRAAGALRPTMVVIEDTQWADEATLALLEYLSRVPGLVGLLSCVTYRDDEVPAGHPLTTLAGDRVQRIPVKRLSSEATTDLAQAMLGLLELPALLTERLQQTTEGNAFFVQELIRSLAAEGEVLRRTVDGWQVDRAALREAQLPASIRQVVGQRLDQLSPETRQVLGWAAVTGLVFWEGAVAEVGQVARAQVRAAMREALAQGLVVERDDSVFEGEREVLFDSPRVREVAYDGIPQADRRAYHRRVAQWLLARRADEVEEHLGLIAEHLERAGQVVQAVVYLERAGAQATAQFANAQAIGYLSRAMDLTPVEDLEGRYSLLLARERVYDLRGDRESQVQDLAALARLAGELGEHRQVEVALRQAHYAEATGDYDAAIETAQAAVDLAGTIPDAAGDEAAGHRLWGRALWRRGEYERARARLEQALRICREIGDRQGQSASFIGLGDIIWAQGDHDEARVYCEEGLRICREIGDLRGESVALNRIGASFAERDQYAEACAYFEQTLRLFRKMGDRRGEGVALNNLGVISNEQADYAGARDYYEQSLGIARSIGDRESECMVLTNLSQIFHNLGDDETAREYGQQGLDIAREIGSRRWQGYALTYLGYALASLGQLDEAADAHRQALDIRRELGQQQLAMDSLAGLARVSLSQGDLSQAQAWVTEILGYLEQEDDALDGTDEPVLVYLTCYRVLHAVQAPRARAVLNAAHDLLQDQAARIADEDLRRSFLEDVAVHREIVREFAARYPQGACA